ncbi:MAG TPA: methylmalonyl Co-A mutase-associated GTPase MeaB [Gemmatimonadales bacterium]|nr:methylmalonyl Co-A mutase-associated GTPase MeaB [Gemmatimonadales bacterium]
MTGKVAADTARVLEGVAERRPASIARALTMVEDQRPGFERLLAELHPRLGHARRIGITGPPGAGKSTLTTALAAELRKQNLTTAIVAVDPTSPFTGGALLGDRIRMERVALDPGIFIRSLATRGSLGGLSHATRDATDVLDGAGFDVILIETVGVGQSELDVARVADSVVVTLVPESGDAIQTLKAGLMEIADIYVVNKSDRPGADRLRTDIEVMLGMRGGAHYANVPAHHGVDMKRLMNPGRAAREAARAEEPARWTPPVLRAVASKDEGVVELAEALHRHARYLETTGELRARRRLRLRERVVDATERKVHEHFWRDPGIVSLLDERVPELEAGTTNPFTVANELLVLGGELLTRSRT